MIRVWGLYSSVLIFLLLPGTTVSSLGQQVRAVMLSAPFYPSDANVDEAFPNQFVFFDHKTLDIILAYRPYPDAPRRVHRIKRPAHFVPEVVSTVSRKSSGDFRYRYVVTNGPTAKQPIGRWFLSSPQPKAPALNKPALGMQVQAGDWEQSFYGMRPNEWAVRFDSRPGRPLSASHSAVFVVDNENRPGVVKAYFHGHLSSADPLPEDVPPEARAQLESVKARQGWNQRVIRTIGPKYGNAASSLEIANDFHVELRNLVRRRLLDGNSPFTRTVSARLEEFIRRPRPWHDVEDYSPPVDEPFRPIGESPDPRSSFEQQLDQALKLALVRP